MALYTYKAIDTRGKSVMGRVEAVNLFDLEQRLSRMELDLVSGAPSGQAMRFLGGRVSRQDLINFCFHLEQLANAGVPVLEGLVDLRESIENPRFRAIWQLLQRGQTKRSQTAIQNCAVDVRSTRKQLLIRATQIRDEIFSRSRFQNANAAHDTEAKACCKTTGSSLIKHCKIRR